MSRLLVFNTDNKKEGQITKIFDRGWMLTGHPDVFGGGESKLSLTKSDALQTFLQFGRMVMVEDLKLPSWAGVIDPPWNAALPVEVTVYNSEYLLSMRAPDEPVLIEGSVGYIAAKMIEMLNAQEDLFVRIGDVSRADPTIRQETLDGRSFWDQLSALVTRSNCEMQTRAERDADGRLIIYLDIADRLGIDTGFLYSDGRGGNATFADLILDGPIVNRVTGINDSDGPETRLRTVPFINEASKALYRTRSQIVQFSEVKEQATLDLYSRNYLSFYQYPRFSFFLNVLDKGDAYFNARLGNTIRVHIANAYLPGGIKGYRGNARVLAMAYSESRKELGVKVGLI